MNIKVKYIEMSLKIGIRYIPVTLLLTFLPLLLGLLIGGIIAGFRLHRIKLLSPFLDGLIAVLKGIPANLYLIIIGIFMTNVFDVIAARLKWSIRSKDFNVLAVAVIGLTLSSIASLSENIRGAFKSVEKGQFEAGYSVGLTGWQTLGRIIIPQMFLVLLPSLTGDVISILKKSSLAFYLGVMDVLNSTLNSANRYYSFLEAYISAAVIYWGLSILIENSGKALERQLGIHRKVLKY